MSRNAEVGDRSWDGRYHCSVAWTGSAFVDDVAVSAAGGIISSVEHGVAPDDGMTRLEGVVFPGFVNDHSHVFHRLLRGRDSVRRGDFWSWREAMYEVAGQLDPDSYRRVAVAAFREMVASGFTSVTEFHYLHHRPDGRPYDDPNVMADALADAAREAGIRLTLLDTCYLSGGFGLPPEGPQRRFSDGTAQAWAERVSAWKPPPGVELGAGIHSVRAVSPRQMGTVAEWAGDRPIHVHLSEQPDENSDCLNHYGRTPAQVLGDAGILGPNVTAVHATHATHEDVSLLAESGAGVCVCPTTERWLGDGIGPTTEFAAAGIPLTIGSDCQAVIDPWEEMRLLELHQRLATGKIGGHPPADLLAAGTAGGGIRVGAPADMVAISPESPRTAGVAPEGLVFAATGADVWGVRTAGRAGGS
ncbi:MAG: formimidoylglutamate deiminase [Actinomycetota bacterium]